MLKSWKIKFRKMIARLYERYCNRPWSFGMPENIQDWPEGAMDDYCSECKEMINKGALKKAMELYTGEIEHQALYVSSKKPIYTTESEQLMIKIEGVQELLNKIIYYGGLLDEKEEKFDKHEILNN